MAIQKLPAVLVAARLIGGGALARAVPAWSLSPTSKPDFRSTDDLLDLLQTTVDDIEKSHPGAELGGALIYAFTQDERKVAVATLSPEPMEPARARAWLTALAPERHASDLLELAELGRGPQLLPAAEPLSRHPGLVDALFELDFLGAARFSNSSFDPATAREDARQRATTRGLHRRQEAERQSEARLAELGAKRKLLAELKALDSAKTPLAIFLVQSNYSSDGVLSMAPMFMVHAVAIPLREAMGASWTPTERPAPADMDAIGSLALERMRAAWDADPEAKGSGGRPEQARCSAIDGRLAVVFPLDAARALRLSTEADDAERSRAFAGSIPWIANMSRLHAVSRQRPRRVAGPFGDLTGETLRADPSMAAMLESIDLELGTGPATSAGSGPKTL